MFPIRLFSESSEKNIAKPQTHNTDLLEKKKPHSNRNMLRINSGLPQSPTLKLSESDLIYSSLPQEFTFIK